MAFLVFILIFMLPMALVLGIAIGICLMINWNLDECIECISTRLYVDGIDLQNPRTEIVIREG